MSEDPAHLVRRILGHHARCGGTAILAGQALARILDQAATAGRLTSSRCVPRTARSSPSADVPDKARAQQGVIDTLKAVSKAKVYDLTDTETQ